MFFRFFVDLVEVLGYQSIITHRAQGTRYNLQTMQRSVYKCLAFMAFCIPVCIGATITVVRMEGTVTPWPAVDTFLQYSCLIPIWGLWVVGYVIFRQDRRTIREERRAGRLR